MNQPQRTFLDDLLATPGAAGHERHVQRVFLDHVEPFADETWTDDYGNAVAVTHDSDPSVAFLGHADEIGFVVTSIDDRGYLHLASIGSPDPAVSKGCHVVVHADDGPVQGVIGSKPHHLQGGEKPAADVADLHVDIGATDHTGARDFVTVGDAVTVARQVSELRDNRLAAPAMDNRTGVWSAAEAFRRAVETGVDATVYAVSTVQEEIGKGGARIVADRLQPDVAVAVDVTFAADSPDVEPNRHGEIGLGSGPAIGRSGINHPVVADALRASASAIDLPIQFEALGGRTGTDADALFETAGGVPTGLVSVPSRYMHTPVEVVDLDDLDRTASLLASFADLAGDYSPFSVEV